MTGPPTSLTLTALLNSLHTHLQSQTQLLPTLHAQLGLPPTALEDELRALQQQLMQSVEEQINTRRKEVEMWTEKCDAVEVECIRYSKALGGNIKATGTNVGDLRKEMVLPKRFDMVSEHQEKLRQVYHTKFEQLTTLTNRLKALARTLGPDYFAQDILEPAIATGDNLKDPNVNMDVTPEKFSKLEKELVRGKAEVSKRLHQLSATLVQIDWLYTELGIAPPTLEDLPSCSTTNLLGTSLFATSQRFSSSTSTPSDPFTMSTPTPSSRTKPLTPLLFSEDVFPPPETDYQRVFANFVAKVEEAEDEGLSENRAVPVGLENVDPTPGLLSWAANLRTSLEETKRRREAHIQAMYDQLEGLWRRLGVDEADMDAFVEAHRGSNEETVSEYEEELERMLELKRERMGTFVHSAREEIMKLWDDLMVGDDERADFAPFADDEHTEELLTIHEDEVRRLKEERRQKAPLLASIKRYFDICEEEKELAAAASDQTRLLGRGRDPGRLLREEKMRKRVSKEKPRLEQDLLVSIPAWEHEAQRPFLVHGESILQILMETVSAQDQENKRKPRAGSVPLRATTPVNSTNAYVPARGGNRGRGSYRGRAASWRGGRGRGRGGAKAGEPGPKREDDGTQLAERFERAALGDEVDEKLGFSRLQEGGRKEGWLVNMHPILIKDPDYASGKSGVDFYFIQDDGGMFKCTLQYEPYFYIGCKSGTETIIEEWLNKKYEGLICRITRERKEDLKLPNHLMGHRRLYLQLHFRNVSDLLTVRRDILPLALANSAKRDAVDAYAEVISATGGASMGIEIEDDPWAEAGSGSNARGAGSRDKDPRESIIDVREYDVPYYLRVAIDNDIRVGLWYAVTFTAGQPSFLQLKEKVKRADPVVMAYDIETTKAPLKFPDQAIDQVMMISYMVDGQGYLITNRDIVSEDIDDFEYTPKEGYEGPFIVFNEPDEAAVIKRFFSHIRDVKPTVMATFNGDFFDFPFLDARSQVNGIDMFLETGFAKDSEDEYKSRTCVHMDCFRWVKRDSYLPQGSQGLKAVTKAKLGYDPTELDPELMTPYAIEQPQLLAQYSVSDAVATYYLYMKYVNPFIFSLCNIIPLNPDEVLRKGSGTLCETLLMVEAYRAAIIMPNRHVESHGNMYDGHLLASETYVGGHVEALEAGVFRSDIATEFKIVPSAVQQLIDDLDAALKFCIIEESKSLLEQVTNYEEVKAEIKAALELMRDNPKRIDKPLIYHLDVAAMYPNIMLSNRLQPDSMVDESVCAVCDYNRPGKTCDRRLNWAWRGEFFPAHRDEYNMIKHALNQETFPSRRPGGPQRQFHELTEAEQTALLHKRLGDYSRKVYKKTKDTRVENREAIVCQRENPFYVDTVRTFRDRRYDYKGLHKTWKKNLDTLQAEGGSITEVDEAKKMIVIYDSLQLAHKCILNSFYGYVMRKGARWNSMEMAGITCLTGATIIQMARALVEQIGRPLELDTDGIWCMLPGVFPENFKFKLANGKSIAFSYPCTMLNHLVHDQFTNHQYHTLNPETGEYDVHSENSIFFELDGPYRAMILPSSKEEDKLLKKRYAVFNEDGSLAELKGFEVKRRGELQLIKIFQSQIFEKFLLGTTTQECYTAVAQVADQWLDVLFSKADSLGDDELVELIAENRSMSKTLAEYGGQKSTSISTAKRLAEFLGDQMVKDKGLACKFIISAKPIGAPVTERAVPVAIFSAEETVKRTYLRKWLKDSSLVNFELRSILDWQYYIERLGSVIQKLITIPAAMQKVSNPVPRIRHPDWLHRRVAHAVDKFKQNKVTDFFSRATDDDQQGDPDSMDIEDFGVPESHSGRPRIAIVKRKRVARKETPEPEPEILPLPDPSVNYSAWIKAMRPRWKQKQDAHYGETATSAVPVMFRTARVRTNHRWDVVQIRPSKIPGRFILWLSVDSELVSVPLRIPREFYIHLKKPKKDEFFRPEYYSVEEVTRNLPRDLPCKHLYKISVREDVYCDIQEHFIDLVNDSNVDGVFEQQVPLVVRGLLRLGKTCFGEEAGMTLNRAQHIGFDLSQLSRAGTLSSRQKYLDGGKAGKYILLYHACSANAPLHVFAAFLPSGPVKLHVVDPATHRQPIGRLQEAYAELFQKQNQAYGKCNSVMYPETREFTTTYHSNDITALKAVSRELGLMEDKSFTVVISSLKDQSYFDRLVPKLAKFPILSMSKVKGPHTLDVFPWQSHVSRKMISRYLSMGAWVDRLASLADYYDIPIGHIEGDQPLYMSDISFARRLIDQDMVLWWSSGENPDLGG
ncbi:hypothetical protein D9615_005436 [Tricholomella constricta]|uniref:DNA polymerase epsilon catalytic subunit n=1 Tax=Tricholomella constricta TaxID=117010 RepID=A0A8H5HED9_9AGAR|nr:hypothetical protein D9615_005436 [Tricholomella constricta]